jgi:hypothetical protein
MNFRTPILVTISLKYYLPNIYGTLSLDSPIFLKQLIVTPPSYLVRRGGPIVTIMEIFGILCFTCMVAIQVVNHLLLKLCCGHLTFPGRIPCLLTCIDPCCSKLPKAPHIFSNVNSCNVWPEGHLGTHGYPPHIYFLPGLAKAF